MLLGLSPLVACDATIALPPYAPATHGMLTIEADVVDGVIAAAEPVLGAMHRGAEKLFESRDYRQVLSLANRHEWLSSFTGELGVALLVENGLGIEAPAHAAWLRTLLVEFHRVTSHLAFLAGYPWPDEQLIMRARQMREQLVLLLQAYAGTRMHTMLVAIGGMTSAPRAEWLAALPAAMAQSSALARELRDAAASLAPGVGVVSSDAVRDHALSGPVARAAGCDVDVRTTAPGLCYSELEATVQPTCADGDTRARMLQLASEAERAADLVTQCATRCAALTGEPVDVLLPKVLRVPDGEYSSRIDTPLGIAHWYLVSTGDKRPHRLALRPASLHTVLALSTALRGARLEDASAIVASMPFVTGDAER